MGKQKDKAVPVDRSVEIRSVFDHYRTYHSRYCPNPTCEHPQWKQISARLKEGYTVEDLCAAIDGCHRSPFHCGENDRGKRYDSLGLIMRDSDHVQQFMEIPENGAVLTERTQRTLRARDSYLNRRLNDGSHDS